MRVQLQILWPKNSGFDLSGRNIWGLKMDILASLISLSLI